jgi:hypothetical protein
MRKRRLVKNQSRLVRPQLLLYAHEKVSENLTCPVGNRRADRSNLSGACGTTSGDRLVEPRRVEAALGQANETASAWASEDSLASIPWPPIRSTGPLQRAAGPAERGPGEASTPRCSDHASVWASGPASRPMCPSLLFFSLFFCLFLFISLSKWTTKLSR